MNPIELIDWGLIGYSTLWILGLSLIMAAISFADYTAKRMGIRLRMILQSPSYQLAINAGLVLFCSGMLGRDGTGWERLLWGILGLIFTYQAVSAWRRWVGR